MNTLDELLRKGSPLNSEPPLDAAELQAMRRAVLNAEPARTRYWPMLVSIASLAVIALTLTMWMPRSEKPIRSIDVPPDSTPEVRRIQFSTPGGTRVFWTMTSNFDVR